MSKILDGLLYSESHEWIKKESDNVVYVGITDFAQSQLGNVVFVDLPEVGQKIVKEEEFGAVESVKAASDLISPVTGVILEVNEDLVGEPELVNGDAYSAWMLKVELSDPSELDTLLQPADYQKISK